MILRGHNKERDTERVKVGCRKLSQNEIKQQQGNRTNPPPRKLGKMKRQRKCLRQVSTKTGQKMVEGGKNKKNEKKKEKGKMMDELRSLVKPPAEVETEQRSRSTCAVPTEVVGARGRCGAGECHVWVSVPYDALAGAVLAVAFFAANQQNANGRRGDERRRQEKRRESG